MSFASDIEEAADDEPIEAIVIGDMGWDGYGNDDRHDPGLAHKGKLLSWEEARPLLDYEYYTGYGSPECHAICAWTKNKVIWVTQYDGATWIDSTYRNPTAHMPDMPGG